MYMVELWHDGGIIFSRTCDDRREAQYVASQMVAELAFDGVRKHIYKIG